MFTRRAFLSGCAAALGTLALGGCELASDAGDSDTTTTEERALVLDREAEETASEGVDRVVATGRLPVFDMHCDSIDVLGMHDWEPYASNPAWTRDGDLVTNNGSVALDRATDMAYVQGYAIWIPDGQDDPRGFYDAALSWFQGQMDDHADVVAQATDMREVPDILEAGKAAAMLSIESAPIFSDGLDVVDELAEAGVKYLGLTWAQENCNGGGNDTEVGLTDLGKKAVARLEDRRIAVDVAHLSDESFSDLMKVHTRPVLASHSNSRAVCDVKRNLTDDQFKAIASDGGVVGLNYYTDFITTEPTAEGVSFDQVAAHIEHWLDLGGEDVVAIGSDLDGATIASWLDGVEYQAGLYQKMADRFGEEQARKLFFSNAYEFFVRNETV